MATVIHFQSILEMYSHKVFSFHSPHAVELPILAMKSFRTEGELEVMKTMKKRCHIPFTVLHTN